jgi:hypothetical protein
LSFCAVRLKRFDQLKLTVRNLAVLVYTELININIFPQRDLGNNIGRITSKRIGQWSTRLYIVLMIIGLAILALYSVFQPQTMTKTFIRPSLNLYNQLIQDYGNELKCSCSSIASTYDQFMKIEPVFHEVRRDYSSPLKMKEMSISSRKIVYNEVHSHFSFFTINYRSVRVNLFRMNGE